jgi:hypothetical protein
MKKLSDAETSFLYVLLNWRGELSAWIKPHYHAGQVAAEVAASGNPSGA